jgi:hypothetical protein
VKQQAISRTSERRNISLCDFSCAWPVCRGNHDADQQEDHAKHFRYVRPSAVD